MPTLSTVHVPNLVPYKSLVNGTHLDFSLVVIDLSYFVTLFLTMLKASVGLLSTEENAVSPPLDMPYTKDIGKQLDVLITSRD